MGDVVYDILESFLNQLIGRQVDGMEVESFEMNISTTPYWTFLDENTRWIYCCGPITWRISLLGADGNDATFVDEIDRYTHFPHPLNYEI